MKIAGVDIGGTMVKMGILDTQTGLEDKTSFPTLKAPVENVCRQIAELLEGRHVDAIGVGTAGSVHIDTGLVYAYNLGWGGVPLCDMLSKVTHLPVWVDNDAQAAMMSEVYHGVLKDVHNAVYLMLGTGIGGALLLNGVPWRGTINAGAEIGHMITHAEGVKCSCGNRGCYEMYASGKALIRYAGGSPVREVFRRVRANDEAACDALRTYAHELCIGLASLFRIFDPDVIVLGGGVSASGEPFLSYVKDEIRTFAQEVVEHYDERITLATHRNDAGVIGAAMLANYYLFDR